MINEDGLEAGKPVDFDTLNKIRSKIRSAQNGGSERTGQEERKEDDGSNKPESKNTFSSARKKKA